MIKPITIVLISMLLFSINGCVSPHHQPETSLQVEHQQSQLHWWRVRFKFIWSQDTNPEFYYDSLVADKILRQVIERYKQDFKLWRFHRRAGSDAAGHQFSLIFYSSRKVAEQIQQGIESQPLVSALLQADILESVKFNDYKNHQNTLIEATSDALWPIEIQKSWPYFIQGASESWLDLLAQIKLEYGETEQVNVDALLQNYREINQALSCQWVRFGRHAYFHHINAIFGYEPVYFHETGNYHSL